MLVMLKGLFQLFVSEIDLRSLRKSNVNKDR